jgi:hypothetical protein
VQELTLTGGSPPRRREGHQRQRERQGKNAIRVASFKHLEINKPWINLQKLHHDLGELWHARTL